MTASLSCDFHIVDVRNSDYTIVVKGSNKLTTISEALSIWGSNTTITGGGTLTLESTGGNQSLFFYPSGVNPPYTLTFDQVTVHNLSGVLGGYSNEKLVINNATLTNKGNIYWWDDIQINGAIISKPAGAKVCYEGTKYRIDVGINVDTDIEITADSRSNPALAFTSETAVYDHNDATHTWPTLTNPHSIAVSYTSSDETVATVNASTGVVTPQAAGNTTITATFAGNESYYPATVKYVLTVTGKNQWSGLELKQTKAVMAEGATLDLSKLVVNPHNLPIVYEVENEYSSNVSVDANGIVTANGSPYAMVKVRTPGNLEYSSGWKSFNILIGTEDEIKKVRYDANSDGQVNITDVVTIVNYILGNH